MGASPLAERVERRVSRPRLRRWDFPPSLRTGKANDRATWRPKSRPAENRRRRQARLVLFDSGDEVTVQAGEEGIRFLLVSGKPLREPVADRDEHAGPVATGGPRASGRDLHRERLCRMRCCNSIAAVALPCARDPTKSRNRCGRASILICGTFAREVLNIRHAIPGDLDRGDRKPDGHAE